MGSKIGRIFIGVMVLLAGISYGKDLNVGDVAPEVFLQGVLPTGATFVSSITESPGDTQSFTIIEFFRTENAECNQNLSPLFEISLDTEEFVATRLVALDEDVADVKAFLKNRKEDIRFPVHFDNNHEAMRAYGVAEVPTIFILKNEKDVIFKHVGAITDDVREKMLRVVGY